MKVYGEVNLSGITKIVINRTVVWERKNESGIDYWMKTAGGKDSNGNKFVASRMVIKLPHEMMYIVNGLLATPVRDPILEELGIHENAYRAWPCGDTLNIGRKDLPRSDKK